MSVVLAEVVTPKSTPGGGDWPLCAGTGWTPQLAERKARGEALERMAGFFHGDEQRIRASQNELGDAAIDPHLHLMFSRHQYQQRSSYRPCVPRPFNPEARVEWTPLRSVIDGGVRYLPTQLLFHEYRAAPSRSFGTGDSNGRAAGSTTTDASLRGLLEVVERDSVALWWHNRVRRPRLALEGTSNRQLRSITAWFERMGREWWALDLTSDLGIPVVVAVSRRGTGREEPLLGFGADLDLERAAVKACQEMSQVHAVLLAARAGFFSLPKGAHRWFRQASLATERHLRPRGVTTLASTVRTGKPTSRAPVFRTCCEILATHGFDVLVADQTREGHGMHVVKVVIPGLRPWSPRFAPGRLYDAPVKAGWLKRPRAESALNPIPIWF